MNLLRVTTAIEQLWKFVEELAELPLAQPIEIFIDSPTFLTIEEALRQGIERKRINEQKIGSARSALRTTVEILREDGIDFPVILVGRAGRVDLLPHSGKGILQVAGVVLVEELPRQL